MNTEMLQLAMKITGYGCAIASGLGSAEWLFILRTHRFATALLLRKPHRSSYVTTLLWVRMMCALAIAFLLPSQEFLLAPLSISVVASIIVYWNISKGLEVADFFLLGMLACLCLYYSHIEEMIATTTPWIIASMAVLSYETAGWSKFFSPIWGTGEALRGIIGTTTFGAPFTILVRSPKISKIVEKLVISLECGYVTIFLLPERLLILVVLLWMLFHLSVAIIMGLNLFFLSYASAYPSIVLVWSSLHQ